MFQCTFTGRIPSKKNRWRRSASGGVYLPKKERDDSDVILGEMIRQRNAQKLWEPMKGDLRVCFSIPKGRCDLDNEIQTLLDLLQKAAIIANDRDVSDLRASRIKGKEAKIEVVELSKS